MAPLRRYPPAEVEAFLLALDRQLRRPVTVTVIGGAAIGLRYEPTHTTTDIDVTPITDEEFWRAVERARESHPIPVQTVGLFTAPYHYEERRTKVAIDGLERLTVLLPEAHDLAIMKAARALTHDLEAVEDIHKQRPLDLETLIQRHYEARTQVTGTQENFTVGFLALVERLFGAKTARSVERRLESEQPPPIGGV